MAKRGLSEVVVDLRSLKQSVMEEFGVSGLWIFGSYARGEQRPDSDVDVLVEFDRPGITLLRFLDLEMRLSDKLGIRVDLVRRSALKDRIKPRVLSEAITV